MMKTNEKKLVIQFGKSLVMPLQFFILHTYSHTLGIYIEKYAGISE